MAKPDFDVPVGTYFTETHEYILYDEDDDRARVGISSYAVEQLGDIVYVELPNPGESFEQGETFGSVESVKAQSDLYLPVSGEVMAINNQLGEEPELLNDNPYNDGWMVEIMVRDKTHLSSLMTPKQYEEFLEELASV